MKHLISEFVKITKCRFRWKKNQSKILMCVYLIMEHPQRLITKLIRNGVIHRKGTSNFLFCFLFLFFTYFSNAKTYYVSNSGKDFHTGLSEEQAWATTLKVNSSNFKPGDSILFKKGDVWRERILFPSSGTDSNHIIISSYGIGNKPIFSSPILSVSWTDLGNGRFSANHNGDKRFLWEGSKQIARATSSALNDGDWFYSSGVIYYRPTTGVPTDHVLNYAAIYGAGNSIDVSDKSYITISGINFSLASIGVVSFDKNVGTNTIKIENCDFTGCWRGIFFMPDFNNNTNAIITNNYFKWCQNAIGMYSTEAIGGSTILTHKNISPVISYNEMDECGTTDGTKQWKTRLNDFEAIGLQNVIGGQIHHNYIHGGFQVAYCLFNLSNVMSTGNHFFNNKVENSVNTPIIFTGRSDSDGFNDNWISYNIFINSGNSMVLDFFQGNSPSQMNYFVNNTVYGKNGKVLVNSWENQSVYLTIANNIFFELGTYVFQCHDPVTDLVLSHNIYHQASASSNPFYFNNDFKTLSEMQALGYETKSQITNPLLESGSVMQLQSGSPAIDAGVDLGLTCDYLGNVIEKNPDIGAYEFKSKSIIQTIENISICEGESYHGWTISGQYRRVLKATSGADSLVTTNLSVNEVYHIIEDFTILEGESYKGWTTSGEYHRILTSIGGCDSIVTTYLRIKQF